MSQDRPPPSGRLPDWISDFDQAARWFEQVVRDAGGYLVDPEVIHAKVTTVSGRDVAMVLDKHRAILPSIEGDVMLSFALQMDADLQVRQYNYDFRRGDDLVVRYDKHPGEKWLVHEHHGVNETPYPSTEHTLSEAIDAALELLATPTR